MFRYFEVQLRARFADANAMRGSLGKALFGSEYYARLFAPEADANVPSGFRNPPRPFALRASESRVHVFSALSDARVIAAALGEPDAMLREVLCPLNREQPASAIRVIFKSPTLLKGAQEPDFATLFARARDRVSTLRSFYGEGPLPIDFRRLGDLAKAVKMTQCRLQHHDIARRSGRTGQVHDIGGFTGVAEYHGELTPFMPILEAAQYTGVGSKASWGNGWFDVKPIAVLNPLDRYPCICVHPRPFN